MADWIKLKVSARENDRIAEACEVAGLAAWGVYTGLLMLHAEFGSHGELQPANARPTRIRIGLPALGMSIDDVTRALDALEGAGLIERREDGGLCLIDADEIVEREPVPDPPHAPVVYFALNPRTCEIKIGTTRHLPRRLASLASSCGSRLQLLGCIAGHYEREREVHNRFRRIRRLGSEWFRDRAELRVFIAEHAKHPAEVIGG